MKHEERELLLNDLCARLPYNVAIEYGQNKCKVVENIDTYVDIVNDTLLIENVKPYLFPLSSMTEEQRKELNELFNPYDVTDIGLRYIEGGTLEDYLSTISFKLCSELIDWLNKHHFDYNGLIDKGLAIDCTNLNIY